MKHMDMKDEDTLKLDKMVQKNVDKEEDDSGCDYFAVELDRVLCWVVAQASCQVRVALTVLRGMCCVKIPCLMVQTSASASASALALA